MKHMHIKTDDGLGPSITCLNVSTLPRQFLTWRVNKIRNIVRIIVNLDKYGLEWHIHSERQRYRFVSTQRNGYH